MGWTAAGALQVGRGLREAAAAGAAWSAAAEQHRLQQVARARSSGWRARSVLRRLHVRGGQRPARLTRFRTSASRAGAVGVGHLGRARAAAPSMGGGEADHEAGRRAGPAMAARCRGAAAGSPAPVRRASVRALPQPRADRARRRTSSTAIDRHAEAPEAAARRRRPRRRPGAAGRALGGRRARLRTLATMTPQRGQAASVDCAGRTGAVHGRGIHGCRMVAAAAGMRLSHDGAAPSEATAPTRIDLAGGTLDIWPLYLFHPGAVTVNAAIDRRAWCRVETGVDGRAHRVQGHPAQGGRARRLRGAGRRASSRWWPTSCARWHRDRGEGRRRSRACRPGSGLGGSSALAVAVAAAAARGHRPGARPGRACGRWCATRRPRPSACPPACRTTWPRIHGGVLGIHLEPGALRVEKLATDPARVEECLLLVDAGVDALLRAQQLGGLQGPDRRQRERAQVRWREIVAAARGVRDGARRAAATTTWPRSWPRRWQARKRLAPGVTTPEIDRIAEAAAVGGRRGQGVRRRRAEAWSRSGRVPGERAEGRGRAAGGRVQARALPRSTCAAWRSTERRSTCPRTAV